MANATPLTVFISSTCYDLVDLRFRLKQFLEENACLVRMSEDPASGFTVDPTADSIESCLANVRASDAVLCIIDRRYGGVMKHGPYDGMSATEAEVRHARLETVNKPVFFFIRTEAFGDYQKLKADPKVSHKWVEPKDDEQAARWKKFVDYAVSLPEHAQRSNWCDQFKSVVDLEPIALKRLHDHFPQHALSEGLRPDRLVRLTFIPGSGSSRNSVQGHFHNIGVGPALNITHGIAHFTLEPAFPGDSQSRGGLREGTGITAPDGLDLLYSSTRGTFSEPVIFCEYQNRFGDVYRVEQEFFWPSENSSLKPHGEERFFVGLPTESGSTRWVRSN